MNMKELHERRIKIKDEIAQLNEQLKDLKKELDATEQSILENLEQLGVESVVFDGVRYAPTQDIVPKVEDWDALYNWIMENQMLPLLHRRVSARVYKELLDSGEEISGTIPTALVKLSARKI